MLNGLSVWHMLFFSFMHDYSHQSYRYYLLTLSVFSLNFFLGNKLDQERAVSVQEAQEFAKRMNMSHFEVSAKTGAHIGIFVSFIYILLNSFTYLYRGFIYGTRLCH